MSHYQLERAITDLALTTASVDLLALLKKEMTEAFDQLRIDADLPSDARPLWRLSWQYDEEREEAFREIENGDSEMQDTLHRFGQKQYDLAYRDAIGACIAAVEALIVNPSAADKKPMADPLDALIAVIAALRNLRP
jgi:hypothetical protein